MRITINQRRDEEGVQGGIVSWLSLGDFRFEPGREARLEIGTMGSDGAVLADAVLFCPGLSLGVSTRERPLPANRQARMVTLLPISGEAGLSG